MYIIVDKLYINELNQDDHLNEIPSREKRKRIILNFFEKIVARNQDFADLDTFEINNTKIIENQPSSSGSVPIISCI